MEGIIVWIEGIIVKRAHAIIYKKYVPSNRCVKMIINSFKKIIHNKRQLNNYIFKASNRRYFTIFDAGFWTVVMDLVIIKGVERR